MLPFLVSVVEHGGHAGDDDDRGDDDDDVNTYDHGGVENGEEVSDSYVVLEYDDGETDEEIGDACATSTLEFFMEF
jgi:hypothetical protein